MERVDVRISLDTEFKGCEKQIKLVQGESKTRKLIATITEGSRVIDLDPTTEIAIIRGLKPDKTPIYNICEIIDGKVYYTFSTQDTATSGTGLYEIQIVRVLEDAVSVLHSVQFNTWVQENVTIDGEVESTGEYTALTSLIAAVGQFGDINQRLKDIENEIITVGHGRAIYTGQSHESSEQISITGYDRFAFEKCIYGADIEIPLLRYLDVTVDLFYIDDIVNPAKTITITDAKQILDIAGYDRLVINIDQGAASTYYKIDYKLSAATFYTKEVINNLLATTANNLKLYMQENYVPQSRSIAGYVLNNDISTTQLASRLLANNIMELGIKADALEEVNQEIDDIIADNISYILSKTDTDNALKNYLTNNVLDSINMNTTENIAHKIFKRGIEDYSPYLIALDSALRKTTILNIINTGINDTHYTKAQVDSIIGALNTGGFKVVKELPETGTEKIIYLLPKENKEERNIYEEYIWIPENEDFEKIGDTGIDLSDYAKLTDISSAVSTLNTSIAAAEQRAKDASVPTTRKIGNIALNSDISRVNLAQEIIASMTNYSGSDLTNWYAWLNNTFPTKTNMQTALSDRTKIYIWNSQKLPADPITEFPGIKGGDLIHETVTDTFYLTYGVTTTTASFSKVVKPDEVINSIDGIKIYIGSGDPTTNLSNYPGIQGGDLYFTGAGSTRRNNAPLINMYYAYIYGNTLYWEQIMLERNAYTKTEVDTLLDAKQPVLTAGNNLNINSENTISYKESEWELLKTVEATEDNPLSEIVWQASDLVNGTYDDIMVKATGVQGNTVGNYAMQCKTTANKFNAGLFGTLLSSAVSTSVARNFFTTIERLNGTTEFDISSWYVDNYLNKEIRVINTAPDLVATDLSHKLYYVRIYFSSTNTIKSGKFKIYGRKRIY